MDGTLTNIWNMLSWKNIWKGFSNLACPYICCEHLEQEESEGRLVEMEEKHKSEMKTLQTNIAGWTEVSLNYMLDRVYNGGEAFTIHW